MNWGMRFTDRDISIMLYQLSNLYAQNQRTDLRTMMNFIEFQIVKDSALDNENRINTHKEFVSDKLLKAKKLLRLKAELESEIDILKEEYNKVSRRFRYDLLYDY